MEGDVQIVVSPALLATLATPPTRIAHVFVEAAIHQDGRLRAHLTSTRYPVSIAGRIVIRRPV